MNTSIKRQITDLSLASPTIESCGFVILRHDGLHLMPCLNSSPTPSEDFEISIHDTIAARNQGDILYVWHSHPRANGFSEADLESAEESALPQRLFSIPDSRWYEYYPTTYRRPLEGRVWCWGEQDCLGIVRDYFRPHGVLISDYDREESTPNLGATVLGNFEKEGFLRRATKEFKLHDVLIFNTNGSPQHMTIFVGNTKVLHHPRQALSRVDQFNAVWRARLHCVCYHPKLDG